MTEFESVILKSLLQDGEFFGKQMPILEKKYFREIGNSYSFGIIKDHYDKYNSIPNFTELVSSIKNIPKQEVRDEIKKSLSKLANIEPAKTEFMLSEVVTFVKDALYLEALELGSEGLMKRDESLKMKAEALLDLRSSIQIDTDLGLQFEDINAMIEYYSTRNVGIRTSSKEINKRLGPGFLPGTLSLILQASGIGKSVMMSHIVSDLIKNNKKILLVSLEMSDKEFMKRVHANALDLPINSLDDLSKTEGELKRLDRPVITKEQIVSKFQKAKMSGRLGQLYIKEYPPGEFSSMNLNTLLEEYKLQRDLEFDIVFVDYLGIMKSDRVPASVGLYSYVKSIAEELRAVQVKRKLPIISAQQLNRSAINNREADNSSVSDSLGSVMTADFLMFLLQDEEMKENQEMVMKVTKNRLNGRTDTFMMNIDYEKMRFTDMQLEGSADVPFGTGLTSERQSLAEDFANSEVKRIESDSWNAIKEIDKKNTFDSTDDILKELGL